jgi:hypothetical protein
MDYESLSSVVLAVMAAVLVLGWLPRRTTRGMKRASEHREDRFSPSLHIVDAKDATLFSDEGVQQTKGLSMESQQQRHDSAFSPQRVARIRTMRRQAVRRRQILVASLVVIAAVLVLLGLSMQFSPLVACIPAALAVIVLALGAKASADARRWEQELSEVNKRHVVRTAQRTQEVNRKSNGNKAHKQKSVKASAAASSEQAVQAVQPVYMTVDEVADLAAENTAAQDGPATDVIAAGEVHEVLRQAQQDKQRALALREQHKAESDADVKAAVPDEKAAHVQKQERGARQEGIQSPVSADKADITAASQNEEIPDVTNELHKISPSRALDAFEMAASQDLISFSLGGPRNRAEAASAEAQSLEIKSVRQVSKAVPKDDSLSNQQTMIGADVDSASAAHDAIGAQNVQDSSAAPAGAASSESVPSQSVPSDSVDSEDARHFHDAEATADVDAPEQTSDSLGVSLESILARRNR